jgi:hypothetical protein
VLFEGITSQTAEREYGRDRPSSTLSTLLPTLAKGVWSSLCAATALTGVENESRKVEGEGVTS